MINRKEKIMNNDRYLHHFHCSILNAELNMLLTKECSREKIKQKKERLDKLFSNISNEDEIESIIQDEKHAYLYKNMTRCEINWFNDIIKNTENMPICVSISSTSVRKFPLIYVNKQFEKMTKYKRFEILGKNCSFLQPSIIPDDENIQYILMKNALENMSQISLIITNVKADGTSFQNLLALYPIKDKNGNSLYIIGVQTEITSNHISKEDIINIQNVIDLFYILQYNIK